MAPLRTLAALLVCLGSASAFAPVTSTVSRQAVATPRYVGCGVNVALDCGYGRYCRARTAATSSSVDVLV